MMRQCDRAGCNNEARWSPGFRIYPHKSRGDQYATSMTGLAVCDACKEKLQLSDLATDEGWAVILREFASRGLARPCRKRTELMFTLLEDVPGSLKPN